MISLSEQNKRPIDMLIFLGEYFKKNIEKTDKVQDFIDELKNHPNKKDKRKGLLK